LPHGSFICSQLTTIYVLHLQTKTESVCVVTGDGRIILGQLVGHDQVQNLILNQAQERVYMEDAATEIVELGLYVIRGDNVCLVGDFDPDSWKDAHAPSLRPIQQQQN
jgi:U6 snRNA-associated Sm-like protein LSm8